MSKQSSLGSHRAWVPVTPGVHDNPRMLEPLLVGPPHPWALHLWIQLTADPGVFPCMWRTSCTTALTESCLIQNHCTNLFPEISTVS